MEQTREKVWELVTEISKSQVMLPGGQFSDLVEVEGERSVHFQMSFYNGNVGRFVARVDIDGEIVNGYIQDHSNGKGTHPTWVFHKIS